MAPLRTPFWGSVFFCKMSVNAVGAGPRPARAAPPHTDSPKHDAKCYPLPPGDRKGRPYKGSRGAMQTSRAGLGPAPTGKIAPHPINQNTVPIRPTPHA
jgi:hypothetical protein